MRALMSSAFAAPQLRRDGPSSSCLELPAGEILFGQADVVIDLRGGQLGARAVPLVRHDHVEGGPDAFDLLELLHLEVLDALVAPVEDVRGGEDELVLEDEAD